MKTQKQVFDMNQLERAPQTSHMDYPVIRTGPSADPHLTYSYGIRYFENLFQDFIFFSFWSAIRNTTLGLDHGLSGRQS